MARSTRRQGAPRRIGIVLALGAVLVAQAVQAPAGNAAPSSATAPYLVQLRLDPVVTYGGDVAGLAPTAPARGAKVDPQATPVVDYVRHLQARHDAVLSRLGAGQNAGKKAAKKLYDYAYSFDGFAAQLTASQAAALARDPDVVSVTKDRLRKVDTSSTTSFLGLDAPGGLWDQLGGPTGTKQHSGAGEGIVIGDIDSGIWPDVASFSDRDGRGHLVYGPIHGFHGHCDSATKVGDDSWDANLCNKKLVAARHFDTGWGGDAAVHAERPWEFLSPRDYNGHGTHTASTAAGNSGVIATNAEKLGPISGVAPRARIAAYKALWSTQDGTTAQGYGSDIVAAIDQAVADGVDVINYSVSGTNSDLLDPVELSLRHAAESGVFVAAAGGNSGPASATVAHPSPWLTTVAAGTHSRTTDGAVRLGNGKRYTGASIASGVGPAPLIDAVDAPLDGAQSWQAELCYPAAANDGKAVLDPARVRGKIVVCDEGNIAPWAKSRAVKDAGGIGMILTHEFDSPLTAYVHAVPTLDIATSDKNAIKAYAGTAGATATIEPARIGNDAPAPKTASFSSRGPLMAAGGNLLKPDLIAPGQDILAAVAPPGNYGLSFNILSGTSMATPQVAGLAALLAQRHPGWSPMMIKSALMTSGSDVRDGPPTDPAVIFSEGAGHVRPTAAADPGLVYDSDADDWTAFLCGTTDSIAASTCNRLARTGHPLDPSDLNLASIAIGALSQPRTVTRKVTNVGSRTATYRAHVDGLDGLDVTVSPSRLTIRPGQTKAFTVTIARDTAEPNRYYGGHLTWTDGHHAVRSPIVVRLVRPPVTDWAVDTVAGGPTFDATTQTGYFQPELPVRPGHTAGDGLGVAAEQRFGTDGQGKRVIRWNADGWVELGGLGTNANGDLQSYVYATAPDGTAVGNAGVWSEDGTDLGNRPVRWDAGSTKAVRLDGLGTSAEGRTFGAANAINAAGTIAGDVDKYAADGTSLGHRAVRWDAGHTTATELGAIGAGNNGSTNAWTRAIDADGDIAGYGVKQDSAGNYVGVRAIRWDAGQTAATELGVLGGADSYAQAYDINDAGTTVGETSAAGGRGTLAVRWDAHGTAATGLGALGTSPDGFVSSSAYAINNAGTIVGTSAAYSADGTPLGNRAVYWAPGSTSPTELDQLEIGTAGQAQSAPMDVNDSGVIVGSAHAYSAERPDSTGDRAVLWTRDGKIVDLTSLLPADSGWTLTQAMSVSDSGWVTALGLYDPDGAGSLGAYFRLCLLHVQAKG